MFEDMLKIIREEFSGQAAKSYVGDITRYHRIQASPGFRAAARYCLDKLAEFGVQAEILSFPANYETKYWSQRMFQEWEAKEATLHLIEPEEERRKLADFKDCPISLIQRSAPFDGEAEVVLLEDGEEEEDYAGLDITGKLVITKGDLDRVRELAVEKRGALGIVFDGMREFAPVRSHMDIPDALQYTSFWWTGKEKKCFGFVLSPKEGERLRALVKKRSKEGKPVKLRAKVESRFYDGEIEVVSAIIPGQTDEEVLVISHLCHPQPSANDNASGSATALEIARTLFKLIKEGRLSKPRRGIRFLWVPEMTGTYAYLSTYEEEIKRMVAGVNLDMVGQNQDLCGSSFLVESSPGANPSFAPYLLERLREEFFEEFTTFGGTGKYPLFRYATSTFSGGSDHYILSDPSVDVPTPMLIQWPDRFYHTSYDTLDKVDPAMLSRIGTIAATYVSFIASSGRREAAWLGYEMVARFKANLVRLTQSKLTEAMGKGPEEEMADLVSGLEKKVNYLVGREKQALRSLQRLWPDFSTAILEREVEEVAGRELGRFREIIGPCKDLPITPDEEPDEWEREAEKMVPRRIYRGPVNIRLYLRELPEEDRERWWKLSKEREKAPRILPTLAEYWADGKRNVLEIAELVELETDYRDVEFLVEYFRLLAKANLVELR